MVPVPLRVACALVAAALFLGAIVGLVLAPRALDLVPLFGSAIVAMPAMFGGKKPTESDLPRIDEQLRRFRTAMFVCFGAAFAIYATVISGALRHLALLGAALWLVGFVLMFFAMYYRAQRRLALR